LNDLAQRWASLPWAPALILVGLTALLLIALVLAWTYQPGKRNRRIEPSAAVLRAYLKACRTPQPPPPMDEVDRYERNEETRTFRRTSELRNEE
jgi:hypothetical protein